MGAGGRPSSTGQCKKDRTKNHTTNAHNDTIHDRTTNNHFGNFYFSSCIFVILGPFGHFQVAAFLFLLVILAIFRPAFLLFPAIFAIFRGLHFFVIFGHFGHFREAALLVFSASLGGGCIFIYLFSFIKDLNSFKDEAVVEKVHVSL